jgi:putative nucleotidyltransferase with HDIG domain
MFVICALLPILALSVFSYIRVTSQLEEQALERLRQSTKSHALWIFERLTLADRELQSIQELPPNKLSDLSATIGDRNRELFSGVALFRDSSLSQCLSGVVSEGWAGIVQKVNIPEGHSTLSIADNESGPPSVVLVRKMTGPYYKNCYLAGTVKPSFLWGMGRETLLPPGIEFVVWDDQGKNLYSSLDVPISMNQGFRRGKDKTSRGQNEVTLRGERYYGSMWSVFLKPRFHIPVWNVMVLETQSQVFAPLNHFRFLFFSIVLLSLIVTIWISGRAIKKSLIPIDMLMEGAYHVSNQDFTHQVIVNSRDEFRDLAKAFNRMTSRLDWQFKALVARSDLDVAILSTLDVEQIIATSLNQSSLFFNHRIAAISTLTTEGPVLSGYTFVEGRGSKGSRLVSEAFCLSSEEYKILDQSLPWIEFGSDGEMPSLLKTLNGDGIVRYVIFPIRIRDRLFALVSFGLGAGDTYSHQDMEQMRDSCNHLAVAFSNTDLVRELKELNMGTLLALARTVDAKSPWTAGHSARVAQIALEIAGIMDLPERDMEILQTGALLHDIGKIGVSTLLLNKNGKLTDEEFDSIKAHPVAGSRILAPIKAYASILPIVEQHHERYDGRGYPHGLAGEQISRLARIVTLADAFDAMISDRPYRSGLSEPQAIAILEQQKGLQFDPSVVDVFSQVISRRKQSLWEPSPLPQLPEIIGPVTVFSETVVP